MSERLLVPLAVLLLLAASAIAQAPPGIGEGERVRYRAASIEESLFTADKVGMLELECKDIAESLAGVAMERFEKRRHEWTKKEAVLAEKIVVLARHLDPRCKIATEMDKAFASGAAVESRWEKKRVVVLVETLVLRAKLLRATGKADDVRLAACFLDVAAEIDPKNENAIYAFEIFRRDVGSVNWDVVAGRKRGKLLNRVERKGKEKRK